MVSINQYLVLSGAACSVLGGVIIWKDTISGKRYYNYKNPSDKNLHAYKDKVFIVTGANTGIGKEIAWELSRLGCRVYMACRNMLKCEQAREEIVLDTKNKYVYCRKCDLSSQSSIRAFVKDLKIHKLSALIHNAGVLNVPPNTPRTPDGMEQQWAVNHLGPFLLNNLLFDILKNAHGRIIYLMNLDYRKGTIDVDNLMSKDLSAVQAFCASQLANMLVIRELSKRLAPHNITVNAVYPGVVGGTQIKRYMGIDSSISGNLFARPILWFFTKSPRDGAQTPLFLSLDDQVSDKSGKLFCNLKELEIDDKALDELLAKQLYVIDEYWTGLKSKQEILESISSS